MVTANWGARAATAALATVMIVALGACAPNGTDAIRPSVTATEDPPVESEAPELTVDDIATAVADGEWSYALDGVQEPFLVTVVAGTATDEHGRQFTVGDAVAGDADGDGIIDAAIPIAMVDGNAFHELWYIWLGREPGTAPEQVIYPIARSTRCGDVTRSVTAAGAGFTLDIVLRMPYTDDARSCADGGTGALTRTVSVTSVDGTYYPVQSAPIAAWGGVCPPTTWLDGVEELGIAGRAAPPASAPVVIDTTRPVALFALGDAPLLTASGVSFFGFIQDDADVPVKMHCAFAD
ncbi:MAG TPA: hypothetical protein VEP72_06595 [Microbacterium sp.]|nr:hypothetical protein [Microbacterium sp.]